MFMSHFYLLTIVTHPTISMWMYNLWFVACILENGISGLRFEVPTILHFTALHYGILLPSFVTCDLKAGSKVLRLLACYNGMSPESNGGRMKCTEAIEVGCVCAQSRDSELVVSILL